jgi:diacylglycerol kinase family enzyme
MRVSLVHNRKAGGRGVSRRQLEGLLDEFGYEIAHSINRKDDWEPLLEDPGDMVVVAGGDGTVGAVARKLVRREVPIAVLPLGTANNIARGLGIDGLVREIVAGWRDARRLALDLGTATGPWGKTWFIEGFGVGLLASAMAQLHAQDKLADARNGEPGFKLFRDRLGLSALLGKYEAMHLAGALDDQPFEGDFLLLEAMNLRAVGPALALAPDADPADGLLDFVLLPESRRTEFADCLAALRDDEDATVRLPVEVRRGRSLRLAGNGHDAHIDDRVHRADDDHPAEAHLDIEIGIDVAAVQMLVPAGPLATARPPAAKEPVPG